MIDSVFFENFKCFDKRQSLKCGLITLLYGKNSTGKTSALKGLSLIDELMSQGAFPKADRTYGKQDRNSSLSAGDSDKLSFSQGKEIGLGIKVFPPKSPELNCPNYSKIMYWLGSQMADYSMSIKLQKMQIEDVDDRAFFTYKPETDLREIIITKELSEYISKFDNYHDYTDFKSVIYHHHNKRKKWLYGLNESFEDDPKTYAEDFGFNTDEDDPYYSFHELSHEITDLVFRSNKFSTLIRKIIRLYNNGSKGLLHEPLFGFGLDVCLDNGWLYSKYKTRRFSGLEDPFWCCNLFEILCHSLVIDRHNSISFVPINFSRKRAYDTDEVMLSSNQHFQREFNISDFVKSLKNHVIREKVNENLKTLGIGYQVVEPDFNKLKYFFEIEVVDTVSNKKLNMYDVGYGIIHTIFCVTSMISLVENEIVNKQKFLRDWDDMERNSYSGGGCDFYQKFATSPILLFEEPEVHFHPDLQSKFITAVAALASGGLQVIIDTHSEIFALQLSKILNNKGLKKDFESKTNNILPSVALNYFKRNSSDGSSEISHLFLDEEGFFIDENGNDAEWPEKNGFFGYRHDL